MDFRMQRRTAGLFLDIFKQKQQVAKIKFKPQKARYRRSTVKREFRLSRSTPEREGISSGHLTQFLREAQVHPTINPHTILVLRNGKIISECSYAPYRSDVWHVTHSMCKGITALAIGMLADAGKLSLDEKLCDIFPGKLTPLGNPLAFRRFKTITIRHLLTMSSGVNFNEAGAVTTEDWIKEFFESGVRFDPGTEFAYNSMNTYMLSAVVKERAGMGLMQFLRPRLFVPLGIERVHWETCPRGIEKGGWGLYLCPEDMAKIGQLMLQKGIWENRRLISSQFIDEMTSKKIDTPPEMGEQGYGYQTWMGKRPGSYLFNGILGQNIIVMPDVSMVIVTTGGNDCLFKTSTIISLVEKYFASDSFSPPGAIPPDKKSLAELRNFEAAAYNLNGMFHEEKRGFFPSLGRSSALPQECVLLDGKTYEVTPCGARLLPLFTQLLQNNYTTCIDMLSFSIRENRFFLTVGEGTEKNRIELSFEGEPACSNITVNHEPYLVAASARFARDEDGNTVLKVLLPFLENSNGRKIKIFFFRDGSIELRLAEIPDFESLLGDTGFLDNKNVASWLTKLVAKNDGDIFEYTVRRAVEPRVRGKKREPAGKTG